MSAALPGFINGYDDGMHLLLPVVLLFAYRRRRALLGRNTQPDTADEILSPRNTRIPAVRNDGGKAETTRLGKRD